MHLAAAAVRDQLIGRGISGPQSPLYGARPENANVTNGRLVLASDSSRGETFEMLLRRQGGQPVEATVRSAPGDETKQYAMSA